MIGMTVFEKLVLRLLLNIWDSVRQTPGVPTYDEDIALYKEVEEAIK